MAFDFVDKHGRERINRIIPVTEGQTVGEGPYKITARADGCVIFGSRTSTLQGRFADKSTWGQMIENAQYPCPDALHSRNSLLKNRIYQHIESLLPNLRYSIRARIAGPKITDLLRDDIRHCLSTLFGGCTLLDIQGCWASDGNEFKSKYEGSIEISEGIEINLLVMPSQRKEAREIISNIFNFHVIRHGLTIENIHFEGAMCFSSHIALATPR